MANSKKVSPSVFPESDLIRAVEAACKIYLQSRPKTKFRFKLKGPQETRRWKISYKTEPFAGSPLRIS